MNIKPNLVMAISASVMVALGCASEPPKCSEEDTLSVLKELVSKSFLEFDEASKDELSESIRFELPRATAFDEKIKKFSCEARLVAG